MGRAARIFIPTTVLIACGLAATGATALPTPEELAPGTVMHVSEVPTGLGTITVAEFDHAVVLAAAAEARRAVPKPGGRAYERLKDSALTNLLEAVWLKGLATEMHIFVSPGQISRFLADIRRENFPSAAEYRRFLEEARYTRRDLRERAELQLLSDRIMRRIEARIKNPAEEQKVFDEFVDEYNERWRSRTVCAPEYVTDRCSNGPPRD